MNYEVTLNEEQIKACGNPHLAYGSLRKALNNKITTDNDNPLNYIIQTTNEGKSLKITATFSEERKQYFIEHPL